MIQFLATLMQVLGKCQLLEAVREKEQGLDSLGRIPCYIYILFPIMLNKLRHFGWIIVKPKKNVTLNLPKYIKFRLGVTIHAHYIALP
jgi:hypothetical protein